MTPVTTFMITFATVRVLAIAAIAFSGLALASREASAYSTTVKLACATDYFKHCSQHSLSSPGVHQCMNTVGPQLSKRCIDALVQAGEVSRAEADRRLATMR
ncbi:MAG: hypothetical protein ABL894_14515 [Hyphomicrobium sp.]